MKKFFSISLVMLAAGLIMSCEKQPEATTPADPATLSVQVKNAQILYEVPKSQSQSLELTVKANPTSAENYTITLKADQSLVASYNEKYNTDYEMIPAGSYSMVENIVQLIRHNPESSSCELKLKGEGCELEKVYVLPIVIDNVEGGSYFKAPEDKSAFILFKMVPAQAQGAGSESDPYLVSSLDEFFLVPNLLKENATTYFKLVADIDLSGIVFSDTNPWEPVKCTAENKIFFEGDNHSISGLKADAGLFATLVGTVQNLTIDGAEITNAEVDDLGVLANVAGSYDDPDAAAPVVTGEAFIKNVTITNSKVDNGAHKRAGGLAGRLISGSVENTHVACTVDANSRAGGLLGYMDSGSVTDSSASGDVTTPTYMNGGLIGWAGSVTITGCHATGKVTSNTSNYNRAGGLIGQIEGNSTIQKCYATGDIVGTAHMGGGLIGVIGKDGIKVVIDRCYATGNVSLGVDGNFAHAGGLLGTINALDADVTISNCYSTGKITAKRYSGGFVGTIYSKAAKLSITNSYTTADLSGIVLADRCGMLIGSVDGGESTTLTCKGFIAWKTQDSFLFCYPDGRVSLDGNYYGNEGTISQQAKALNWDESIWDLSADEPKLK